MGAVLDNFSVAVMTQFNELTNRHGMTSADFVATIHTGEPGGTATLRFEDGPDPSLEPNFARMLHDLGLTGEAMELNASEPDLLNALRTALSRAPAARLR